MNEYPRLVSWSYRRGFNHNEASVEREELMKIYIMKKEGESILEDGNIACLVGTSPNPIPLKEDPYFEIVTTQGATIREKEHGKLRDEMRSKYPELERALEGCKSLIKEYGEYVYINLPPLSNQVNPITIINTKFQSEHFIRKEDFDKDLLIMLISYKPLSLDKKVIEKYKNRYLKNFFAELKVKFPQLYKEVLADSEWLQNNDGKITLVGRTAKVKTLKPGFVIVQETYLKRDKYFWDGKELTAFQEFKYGTIEKRIVPMDHTVVEIYDDAVCNENMIIVD